MMFSNTISEKHKLWKEWKQRNTSNEKYLEAKTKAKSTVFQAKCTAEMKRFAEAVVPRYFVKKVFLEISQKSQ